MSLEIFLLTENKFPGHKGRTVSFPYMTRLYTIILAISINLFVGDLI